MGSIFSLPHRGVVNTLCAIQSVGLPGKHPKTQCKVKKCSVPAVHVPAMMIPGLLLLKAHTDFKDSLGEIATAKTCRYVSRLICRYICVTGVQNNPWDAHINSEMTTFIKGKST